MRRTQSSICILNCSSNSVPVENPSLVRKSHFIMANTSQYITKSIFLDCIKLSNECCTLLYCNTYTIIKLRHGEVYYYFLSDFMISDVNDSDSSHDTGDELEQTTQVIQLENDYDILPQPRCTYHHSSYFTKLQICEKELALI